LLYLTWRDGLKRSLPYWLVAVVFGPVLYVFGGTTLFGSHFHYFTWQVPRNWSEFSVLTLYRYLGFILLSYPVLALSGSLMTLWIGFRDRKRLDVWYVQFAFALLTGLMGTLDIGSSDNVYIPVGTWFILVGVLGLYELATRTRVAQRYALHLVALLVTLAVLFYNPLTVTVSSRVQKSYADLVGFLHDLDGSVYAPALGQLQGDYTLYPAAHWVALEDMIRGPGRDTRDHPNTRRLLEPALHPSGPAYILYSSRP
jgi:hypothetical protein